MITGNNNNESEKAKSDSHSASQIQEGYFVPVHVNEKEDEINFMHIRSILKSYRRFIIITTLIVFCLGIYIALTATPVYRSEILLSSVSKDGQAGGKLGALASQFGGLANIAGISLPSSGNIETTIAILKSRQFIVRFINDHNLKRYLYAKSWDEGEGKWIVPEKSFLKKIKEKFIKKDGKVEEGLLSGEPSDWKAFDLFVTEILQVYQDPSTRLVTVSVDWRDPEYAAVWANRLVERLNSDLRKRTISEAENSIEYLKEQIRLTSIADLRNVLYRLVEEHTKNMTLAKVDKEYALKVIDPAVPAEDRIRPKRKKIVFISLVFGFVVSVIISLLMGWVRKT